MGVLTVRGAEVRIRALEFGGLPYERGPREGSHVNKIRPMRDYWGLFGAVIGAY